MKLITNIQGSKYDFTKDPIKLGAGAVVGNPNFAEYFQVVDNGALGGSVATFTIIAALNAKELYSKTISIRVGGKYHFTDVEKMLMTSSDVKNSVTLSAEAGVSIYFNKVVLK